MQPVGIGIVGCAHACRDLHRPVLATQTHLWEIRGLYDRMRERAEEEAAAFGPPATVAESLEELLAREDIELLLVLTKPPTTHYEVAMAALRAGKHVLVEKPMAQTTAQCDEMIQAAQDAGVVLTVHQNRRWDRNFQQTRAVIDSGRLGEPQLVRVTQGQGFERTSTWDWGVHLVDQALQFSRGRMMRLRGFAHFPEEDADHQGFSFLEMDFEDRPVITVEWLPGKRENEPYLFPRFYVAGDKDFYAHPAGEQFPDGVPFYEALYRCLREGGPPPVDPRTSRNAIYALELGAESARLHGEPVAAKDYWMPDSLSPLSASEKGVGHASVTGGER